MRPCKKKLHVQNLENRRLMAADIGMEIAAKDSLVMDFPDTKPAIVDTSLAIKPVREIKAAGKGSLVDGIVADKFLAPSSFANTIDAESLGKNVGGKEFDGMDSVVRGTGNGKSVSGFGLDTELSLGDNVKQGPSAGKTVVGYRDTVASDGADTFVSYVETTEEGERSTGFFLNEGETAREVFFDDGSREIHIMDEHGNIVAAVIDGEGHVFNEQPSTGAEGNDAGYGDLGSTIEGNPEVSGGTTTESGDTSGVDRTSEQEEATSESDEPSQNDDRDDGTPDEEPEDIEWIGDSSDEDDEDDEGSEEGEGSPEADPSDGTEGGSKGFTPDPDESDGGGNADDGTGVDAPDLSNSGDAPPKEEDDGSGPTAGLPVGVDDGTFGRSGLITNPGDSAAEGVGIKTALDPKIIDLLISGGLTDPKPLGF